MNKLKRKNSVSSVSSESSQSDSEHELEYYINDRIALMKQCLKIIGTRKMKLMAPEWLKDENAKSIGALLLEELLGISNKRLKLILADSQDAINSSSSDSISDADSSNDDICIISEESANKSQTHSKKHLKNKKLKKSKEPKTKKESNDKSDYLNVLDLIELQTRASAIRSQLAMEERAIQLKLQNFVEKRNESIQINNNNNSSANAKSQKSNELVESLENISQNVNADDDDDDVIEIAVKPAEIIELTLDDDDDIEPNTSNNLNNDCTNSNTTVPFDTEMTSHSSETSNDKQTIACHEVDAESNVKHNQSINYVEDAQEQIQENVVNDTDDSGSNNELKETESNLDIVQSHKKPNHETGCEEVLNLNMSPIYLSDENEATEESNKDNVSKNNSVQSADINTESSKLTVDNMESLNSDEVDNEDLWQQRWLNSKKVKEVMQQSKLMNELKQTVKKKLKLNRNLSDT